MGLFDFTKKKESKPSPKKQAPASESVADSLIFDAKLQFLTNSRDYAKQISQSTIEHIKQAIDEKQRKKYHVISSSITKIEKVNEKEKNKNDPMEQGKDVFKVMLELRVGVRVNLNFFDFCFSYLPFFVEVVEPMNISLSANELTDYATSIQSTIHDIDGKLKENKLKFDDVLGKFNELAKRHNNIVRSADRLLRNNVLLTLNEKAKTLDELSKGTGVPQDELKKFVDTMVKDKELKFAKNKYSLP